ncbi:MAG: type II secretion system F family protein [Planctomycetota bacterium]
MNAVLFPAGLLAATAGLGYYWYDSRRREQVRSRLVAEAGAEEERFVVTKPFARRHWWIAILVALAVVAAMVFLWQCPIPLACGVGVVLALVGAEIDAWVLEWRQGRMESQLAEAIDVLVSSVGAGSSLQSALAQAAEFAPAPIKNELDEMVARLRLGDSPPDVFDQLSQRVPMESFRLFAITLSVNWEAGGSLGETLAAIGHTIRDRLIVGRQIRALSTQGRITTIVVLLVTWFMAAMMWQSDPPRFERFLFSPTGVGLMTATLVLQGVGIAMVSKISRPRV